MWKRYVKNLFARPPSRSRSLGRDRRFRPLLDRLEDRTVPSGMPFLQSFGCPNPGTGVPSDAAGSFYPVFWSVGQAGYDAGYSVATDREGDTYVAGSFEGCLDLGAMHLTGAGGADGFIAKYDSVGDLIWVQTFGGAFSDSRINSGARANAIVVDSNDNPYVAGTFQEPCTFGATTLHTTVLGAIDGFVAKLDPSTGNFSWIHQFNGPFYTRPFAMTVDGQSNVLVTGDFSASNPALPADFDFLANPGAHTLNSVTSNSSGFVVKLDSNGAFVWVRNSNSTNGVNSLAIAVDQNNNIYTTGELQFVTGFSNGVDPYFITLTGPLKFGEQYTLKMDPNGTPLWAQAGDDSDGGFPLGIAVDSQGATYTTGVFFGHANFDPSAAHPNNAALLTGVNGDVFVCKLDPSGNFVWVNRAGGSGADYGTGITMDQAGNLFVTGFISADAHIGNQLIKTTKGTDAGFVSEVSPADGTFLATIASSNQGLQGGDRPFAIAVDSEGFIDITGTYVQQTMLPGASTPLTSSFGNDGFVDKISFPSSPAISALATLPIVQMPGTTWTASVTPAVDTRGISTGMLKQASAVTSVDRLFAAASRSSTGVPPLSGRTSHDSMLDVLETDADHTGGDLVGEALK
jgi:hypothetical protein